MKQPNKLKKKLIQLQEVKLKGVKNNPAWKAYQDSLVLYEQAEKDIKEGKAYDYLRERYKNPEKRAKYEKAIGKSLEQEIKEYGERDYVFYKQGGAKRNSNIRDTDLASNYVDRLHIFQDKYNSNDWSNTIVPTTNKIQPIEVLYGVESSALPVYKKPTKPKERTISKLKPQGIEEQNINITANTNIPQHKTIPTVPYNLTDYRYRQNISGDGFRYGEDKDGNLVKIQSREDYRKTNLRPNR